LVFVFLIGLPLIVSEVVIGKVGRKNPIGSFVLLSNSKKWGLVGVMGIIAGFAILSFYSVVAGWTIEYFYLAVTDSFIGKSAAEHGQAFDKFVADPSKPIFFEFIFIALTALVVYAGVKKGIEKYSKLLMPILFVLILFLVVWSFGLNGASKAMKFLFQPDFSKITTEVVLSAMGQAFFSLGVGIGAMIIYGSYVQQKENVIRSAIQISVVDSMIAILAGMAIFPAVFSFGIEPSMGPKLVFICLPNIFAQMTGGYWFGVLFFALLVIAALTSAISILELLVASIAEEFKFSRKKSSIIVSSLVLIIASVCSLSIGVWNDFLIFDKTIFDALEYSSSNVFLPFGAIFITIFVGWKLPKSRLYIGLTNKGKENNSIFKPLVFFIKYIVPIAIFVVFLQGIGVLN
jgi:NSS family neurotransmitter:Na+ symporter